MENIVFNYLRYLNLSISKKYCKSLILSHSDYPSLLSITDTLERLGIRYQVAKINKNNLSNLRFPYLLQIETGWIKLIKDQKDLILFNRAIANPPHYIVLQIDSTEIISNKKNNLYRSREVSYKIIFRILILVVTAHMILVSIQLASWILTTFLITGLGGMALGFVLVSKDIGLNYTFVEAICKGNQKKAKTNCDNILESDAAILYGDITLSDMVASYFCFQIIVTGLVLPVSVETSSWLWVLSVFAAFTLLVIVYSVYYQLVKVKTWCRLCLAVDALLATQALLFVYMYTKKLIYLHGSYIFIIIISLLLFVVVGTSILLIKTKLKELHTTTKDEIKANRIKYSPKVFMALISEKKKINTSLLNQEILIGSFDAPIKIFMAASLTCTPCRKGFEKAIQIVKTYPEKVSLAFRFTLNRGTNSHIPESRYLLLYWLQNIYRKKNESTNTKDLLLSWYNRANMESFMEQYPVKIGDNHSKIQIMEKERKEWFEQAKIVGTPTFFINGYQIPKEYHIEDLMRLVPGLAGQFSERNDSNK